MSWKELLTGYFSFSKKDRIGLIVLLCLIGLAYFLPHFFPEKPVDEPRLLKDIAALDSLTSGKEKSPLPSYSKTHQGNAALHGELFEFDPNTLEPTGWARLGLPERSIKTIMNFRSKGGKFYRNEDLQRIWGLPPGFYERVKDHVRIHIPARENTRPAEDYVRKKPQQQPVNINTADSSELESLPGIGPRLASRINSFREKLGGFYSIDQVAETYGLPDSTFQKIRPYLQFSGEVKKISINQADRDELSRHPYIRWKMANAITEYRKQHGDFRQLEDLKKVFLVDEASFIKMLPYLSL